METIQATITLTLTKEQLLTLLGTAPALPVAPAVISATAPIAAPASLPSAPAQPSSTAQAPSPMPAPAQQMQMAQPMQPPVQMAAPQQMPVQTAPQTYTVQQLGLAARPLMEQGRQQELLALMAEFGVPSIAALPEGSRADFAARLRALGGQI